MGRGEVAGRLASAASADSIAPAGPVVPASSGPSGCTRSPERVTIERSANARAVRKTAQTTRVTAQPSTISVLSGRRRSAG